jgi:hypothetical protein
MVIDMMPTLLDNWEFRRVFKQDLMLALAVAYCNKARELLKDEKVRNICWASMKECPPTCNIGNSQEL